MKKFWRSFYSVPPIPPALNQRDLDCSRSLCLDSSSMATTTKISTNSILTLEEFPNEILFKVLDYLNIDDLFICTHVSRRISEICNDGLLWHKKIKGEFEKKKIIKCKAI